MTAGVNLIYTFFVAHIEREGGLFQGAGNLVLRFKSWWRDSGYGLV